MRWLLALLLIAAGPVCAEAPTTSIIPKLRPAAAVTVDPTLLKPILRPDQTALLATPPLELTAPLTSPLPMKRPRLQERTAVAAKPVIEPVPEPKPGKTLRGKGLCNDKRLVGERLETFGSSKGCGISEPVRIREVSGIGLTASATVDCGTATALADWLDQVAKPAFKKTGGGLDRIQVYASYSCRGRNNQSGAKLSEHGKGHAIDVGGFILTNGQVVTVLGDWGKGKAGQILKDIRRGACGIFHTVLGPGSDKYHSNHFHLDTARYRSGAYCK